MSFLTKSAVSALALSCSIAMIGAKPANAYTLMDLFRGHRERTQSTIIDPGGSALQRMAPQRPSPLPKVTGPTYYTYKPDPLRYVDTGRFADTIVTGAVVDASSVPQADIAASQNMQRRFLIDAKVKANSDVAKVLESYYSDNTRPLVWISGNDVNDRARAALDVLKDVGTVGLDPTDYAVELPTVDPSNPDPTLRERALMQFELELSAKVLTYVQDTVRGRIDPNRISGYHDFTRKTVNLAPVLKLITSSPDVAAYLNSRSPNGPQFQALKAELAKLKAEDASDEGAVSIMLDGLIKPGDSSPQLADIIKAIDKHGSKALKTEQAVTLASYRNTPEYTPDLVALVEGFQREKGLTSDGVIGQATIRAMTEESNAAKIDKLIIAMEQSRWLPADLGSRYVFINQPAYMVYYYNDNQQQLAMRAVVGQKTNQTYFFQDQIETVEFNPFWGVPQSIIINEMLPKLRQDPGYLDRMGYQVAVNGQPVSSSSVNWYSSTNAISVRQPPSSDNALGELKILFPNSHAIYMHDTPSKSFFKKDMRALSHGCVRLADPRAMAAAVLNTTVSDIAKQIATGKNHAVQVPQKIPVYVSYFTAWPNKDGVVEYFDDVYGRDAYMDKAFDATAKSRTAEI
ncbi:MULTISPECIES: murein L,D-transpeptidase [unclassified Sinorhizobium]|uniref:L,D-transpeptidase family protein n=1 Tax=unclassified Sinorhizobium TaxID=2613772 RepID=UPI003524F9CC